MNKLLPHLSEDRYCKQGRGRYVGSLMAVLASCVLLGANNAKCADGAATKALSAGCRTSVVLGNDGTVWTWGRNFFGEAGGTTRPTPSTVITNPILLNSTNFDVVAVSSGGWDDSVTTEEAHTLVLRSDGFVMACGNNTRGQLGNASTVNSSNLVLVTGLTNIIAIAAGGYHSLALRADGTVWSWGTNAYGQLGNNPPSAAGLTNQTQPVQVANLTNVIAIAAGAYHSLALKADGTVWAWGWNDSGQIGNGTVSNWWRPAQVIMANASTTNLTNIIAIAAGGYHCMALRSDGTVWSWGGNHYGQLGITTSENHKTATNTWGISNIVMIAAGGYHSLALCADGTVWGWGWNKFGQVGNNPVGSWYLDTFQGTNYSFSYDTVDLHLPLPNCNAPEALTAISGVIAIAAGEYHSLALLESGTIMGWGNNYWGQVGNGANARGTNELGYIVQEGGLPPYSTFIFSAGQLNPKPVADSGFQNGSLAVRNHSVIAKTDGTAWAFGYNGYGEVGDGTTDNQLWPVEISPLQGITNTITGSAHSVALDLNGHLWAWGWNGYGQIGDGTIGNHSTPYEVSTAGGPSQFTAAGSGETHTIAVQNGFLYGWGGNFFGQLGLGSQSNEAAPTETLSGVTAAACGTFHSLAVSQTGAVWSCGWNSYGQLGDRTFLNRSNWVQVSNLVNAASVSAGRDFSVALDKSSNVWTWGGNEFGQLGNGGYLGSSNAAQVAGLTNIVSVAAGGSHVLALKSDGTVWSWGRNTYGQLGNGSNINNPMPEQIPNLTGVASIYTEENGSFAVLSNGMVMGWGYGQGGALGTINGANQLFPANVNNFWQSQPQYSTAQTNAYAQSGRFSRGTGTDPTYQTFVVPTDGQLGIALNNQGPNTNIYTGTLPWFLKINADNRWHYSAAGNQDFPVSYTNNGTNVYFPFSNPIVAFGSQGGGSPLYVNQSTHFAIYGGARSNATGLPNDIIIKVYRQSDFANGQTNVTNFGIIDIPIPRPGNSNQWSQFTLNNLTFTTNAYGLRTDLSIVDGSAPFGVNNGSNIFDNPILLTHTANSSAFFYRVEASGLIWSTNQASLTNWMVLNTNGNQSASVLYTMDFQEPSPWTPTFLTMPQFTGTPAPPSYITNNTQLTNQFNLTATNYLAIDDSPELRSHPVLDNFVSEMQNDPIALANYVLNQIGLCDAINYSSTSTFPASSVTYGGVNRSALDTFLEGEGSPLEQCSLLIYLLRKAGYPAAYVFPTNNNFEMPASTLSSLLRMQVVGAVNEQGNVYTTNAFITVNYPWVAAEINGTNVSIFPWLKDTEITEGFNVFDYLPTNYNSAAKWATAYLYGDPNILSLNPEMNVPRVLFPAFITNSLVQNYPGLSIDDMGIQAVDRQHYYSRWQDFPVPSVANNPGQSVVIDCLTNTALTNVSPAYTNNYIFNTVSVQVFDSNTNHTVLTSNMFICDVLNRRFFTFTTNRTLTLWLAPYRPTITNISAFTNDTALLNQETQTIALPIGDTNLTLSFQFARDRYLGSGGSYSSASQFLSPNDTTLNKYNGTLLITNRPLTTADFAAICLNVGRVSEQMVDLHAEEYWQTEEQRATNRSSIQIQDTNGTAAFIVGMSYYKNLSDAQQTIYNLMKLHLEAQFAAGLAKFTVHGTNMEPNVDMTYVPVVSVGNMGTDQNDGQDYNANALACWWMTGVAGSAEEHYVINSFFQSTNAISSVRLLQLSQTYSTPYQEGIVVLNSTNYIQRGQQYSLGFGSSQGGSPLDQYVGGALWNASVSTLGDNQGLVFMTPGEIQNNSGKLLGMASFCVSDAGLKGLITADVTANGAFGDTTDMFGTEDATLAGGDAYSFSFQPITYSPDSLSSTFSLNDAGNFDVSFQYLTPIQDTLNAWAGNLYSLQQASAQTLFDIGQNFGNPGEVSFWGQLGDLVADPVDPITGAFHIDSTDITLAGPMPLQLRRNYSSQNLSDMNGFGYGWKLSYLPYLTVTTNINTNSPSSTNLVLFAAEPDGSVLGYRQSSTNTNFFLPTLLDNPNLNNNANDGIGSTHNLFHNALQQFGTNYYQLTSADGSLRIYTNMSFSFLSTNLTNFIIRQRPYLITWQDNRSNSYTFSYGTNSAETDYGQLNRIESSSGEYLQLQYNSSGFITEVFTGDGRVTTYSYDNFGDLVQTTLADNSQINYQYHHYPYTNSIGYDSDHLLISEVKPNGRVLDNVYDAQRRVTNQMSTVGPDLNVYTNAQFNYANHFVLTNSYTNTITGQTFITDVNGNTVEYQYTSNRITAITDELGQTIQQVWWPDFGPSPGYPRSLQCVIDKRGLITSNCYDLNGNLTNQMVIGNLLGDGNSNAMAVRVFAYNSNNLVTNYIDPTNNSIAVTYDPVYTFRPSRVIWSSAGTSVGTNAFYYGAITNIITNGTNGYTNFACGLLEQYIRAFGSPDAATNLWQYDGRGFVTNTERFTGTADSNIVTGFYFDDRGELVQRTDSAWQELVLAYDALGHVISQQVVASNATAPMFQEYFYYNENGQLEWMDGPRSNPDGYVFFDYDGAGRKSEEIHWRSEAATSGAGVQAASGSDLYATTFYQYDMFNDLVRVSDEYGDYTTMAYDAIGQMKQRAQFAPNTMVAMATEGFGYEPGGQVQFYTNALLGVTTNYYTTAGKVMQTLKPDGSSQKWQYYLDGRLSTNVLVNGSFWRWTYDDINRVHTGILCTSNGTPLETIVSIFDRRGNLVTNIDADNFTNITIYDGLDRVKKVIGPAIGSPQQTATYVYDGSGNEVIISNALGEYTIELKDALGRVTNSQTYDSYGHMNRVVTTTYSADFNSATVVTGIGASAITNTTFTDTYGKPVLTLEFPGSGLSYGKTNTYNILEQLISSSDELGRITAYGYDAMGRLTNTTLPDGSAIGLAYDGDGNLLSRTMPGGLVWSGYYDFADRMMSNELSGHGAAGRSFSYSYYPDGLLESNVDVGRQVTHTMVYDAYLRVATDTIDGPLASQQAAISYLYNQRGMATNIFETDPNSTTSQIARSFDGYGQITSEEVSIDGVVQADFAQSWNAAGRRVSLSDPYSTSVGSISDQYRADGLLTSVSQADQNFVFGYDASGLLISRSNQWKYQSISRDGQGRILTENTTVGTNVFDETNLWFANSRISNYTAGRSGAGAWTDNRNNVYDARDHLVSEGVGISNGAAATSYSYTFDGASGHQIGVRTGAQLSGALTNQWSGITNSLEQIVSEGWNQSGLTLRASGSAINASTVSLTLDSSSLGSVTPVDDRWSTNLSLSVSSHTLAATANYANGNPPVTATSYFVVSGTNTVSDTYDGVGNVITRTFTNKTQQLTWDGLGRLAAVVERDNTSNGFYWSAIYDGTGRRIRTVTVPVVNNVTNTIMTMTVDSYYDPQVKYGEVAVALNGQRTWKVLGPDANGSYGGMHGVGGLEATIQEGDGTIVPVVNDCWGNVLGSISTTNLAWNPIRVSAYGPVMGYRPATPAFGVALADTLVWRSRWMDPTGYYQLGARPYDPVAGHFLSADPLGHEASMDLYSFCSGDPLNRFDPTGCFDKGFDEGMNDRMNPLANGAWDFLADVGIISQTTALDNYQSERNPGDYNYQSDAYAAGVNAGYQALPTLAMAASMVIPVLGEEAVAGEMTAAVDTAESVGAGEEVALSTTEAEQMEFGFAADLDAEAGGKEALEAGMPAAGESEAGSLIAGEQLELDFDKGAAEPTSAAISTETTASATIPAANVTGGTGPAAGGATQLEFDSITAQADASTFLRDEAAITSAAQQRQIIQSFGPDLRVGTYQGQAYQYSGYTTSSRYFTPTSLPNPVQQLALPPSNPATIVQQYYISPTRALMGTAASQESWGVSGGAQQIFIPSRSLITPTSLLGL